MTTDADNVDQTEEQAVERRRLWLLDRLRTAATLLRVDLAEDVAAVNTYDMRSAGAVAEQQGQAVWLRVVVEDLDYQPACRWNGNLEANAIAGVPKPRVLNHTDWTAPGPYLTGRRLRGEVMTLSPGTTLADDCVLLDDPHLPETWWTDLNTALDALAATPTNPDHQLDDIRYTTNSAHELLGVDLNPDLFTDLTWTTAHADLHWGNLQGPELHILDWETWRPAPAGYDLATLYCTSLLHPPTAHHIRTHPTLTSFTGQFALLATMCRYLHNTGAGSDLDHLAPQLHAEALTVARNLNTAN